LRKRSMPDPYLAFFCSGLLFRLFAFAAETFFAGFFAPFLVTFFACFLLCRFLFGAARCDYRFLAAFLLAGAFLLPSCRTSWRTSSRRAASRSYRRPFRFYAWQGYSSLERPPRPVASRLLAARKFPAQQRWPQPPAQASEPERRARRSLLQRPPFAQRLRVARRDSGYSGSSPTSAGSSTTARICAGRLFDDDGNAGHLVQLNASDGASSLVTIAFE